jgi:hypothetical protein
MPADKSGLAAIGKDALYGWENVGKITSVSGKTISIRRTLRLSEATWSLLPGAVSEASQLQRGDRIHAKGSTLPNGVYDSKRIFFISKTALPPSESSGGSAIQTADHGGPEAKDPTRELGYPGGTGVGRRLPTGGPPSGGNTGSPGGLQSSMPPTAPRFLPGDVDGVVVEVSPEKLILSQTFVFSKETVIRNSSGEKVNEKALQVGTRVAITIKDELEEKVQARKATVIRILP